MIHPRRVGSSIKEYVSISWRRQTHFCSLIPCADTILGCIDSVIDQRRTITDQVDYTGDLPYAIGECITSTASAPCRRILHKLAPIPNGDIVDSYACQVDIDTGLIYPGSTQFYKQISIGWRRNVGDQSRPVNKDSGVPDQDVPIFWGREVGHQPRCVPPFTSTISGEYIIFLWR